MKNKTHNLTSRFPCRRRNAFGLALGDVRFFVCASIGSGKKGREV